jgi:hypothetical protein
MSRGSLAYFGHIQVKISPVATAKITPSTVMRNVVLQGRPIQIDIGHAATA